VTGDPAPPPNEQSRVAYRVNAKGIKVLVKARASPITERLPAKPGSVGRRLFGKNRMAIATMRK
jgi:hypothetical protein